jgi:hypothetical protein
MVLEKYGLFINLITWASVRVVRLLGLVITEFWWKAPVALIGALQVPLTFFFLRWLGCRVLAALSGAALVAVLPIHVMQSRYTWGYEVLGAFFFTLAIWSFLGFLRQPNRKSGLVASFCSGLYLISHGYIIPFIPCLASAILLYAERRPGAGILGTIRTNVKSLIANYVWIFPIAFAPLYFIPVLHALLKPTRPGFFLLDHLPGFIGNIGVPLLLVLFTFLLKVVTKQGTREATLFALCGVFYLLPLFLGTPPGITVVRGYMLIGICAWLVGAALVLDRLPIRYRKTALLLVGACFVLTLWGTTESIFGRDTLFDPTFVSIERGGAPPDPGSKAAGYLIRQYLPSTASVLAIHRAVEPPILLYYFGRTQYAFYDLSLEEANAKFEELRAQVDVVICETAQIPIVENGGDFIRRATISSESIPRMWIYSRRNIEIPRLSVDVGELNRAFDEKHYWDSAIWSR